MHGRSEPANAKTIDSMLTLWRKATAREKEIVIERIRQEALTRIKAACESLTGPASQPSDRHAT
jgi:hypothetical protein